jgi:hypothetical protein
MADRPENEFEVLRWKGVVRTGRGRPSDESEGPVYRFEHPVQIRHTLVCQRCGREFSYDFRTILRWSGRESWRESSEREALEGAFARERQRTRGSGHGLPVACPYCHTVQGDRSRPVAGLVARALGWFRQPSYTHRSGTEHGA